MYIKNMEMDGFKSYGSKQILNEFDTEFNAISGMNGTGKSNILDAICFVLGIVNLSNVRAASMDDLVYKSGEAGVLKASVTINFDNEDKQKSPIGYEACRIICVKRIIYYKGKSKYLVNDANCTLAKVQDMFRSVGLNVNKPRFLIMQGRVTKVLNMKPVELLGMLEEASNTTLYDQKRTHALKEIANNESRHKYTDDVFNSDIATKINRLRKEKDVYLNYQRVQRETAILKQKTIAFNYKLLHEEVKANKLKYNKEAQKSVDLRNAATVLEAEISEITNGIRELGELLDTDQESGRELLLASMKRSMDGYAALTTRLDQNEEEIEASNRAIVSKNKQIEQEQAEVVICKDKLSTCGKDHDTGIARREELQQIIAQNEEKITQLACGQIDDGEGHMVLLPNLISDLDSKISQLQVKKYSFTQELNKINTTISDAKAKLANLPDDCSDLEEEFYSLIRQIDEIKPEIEQFDFDHDKYVSCKTRLDLRLEEVNALKSTILMEKRRNNLQLEIEVNERINKKNIIGAVGMLFQVKDPKFDTAMEIATSGVIKNFVVDTSETAVTIMKTKMTSKTFILPLDSIKPNVMDRRTLELAYSLYGRQNVWAALDLIEYDPKYKVIMEYMCGNILICRTGEVASQLCFDPRISKRCITLDGDDYNPYGIMSGGSTLIATSIFDTLKKIKDKDSLLDHKEREVYDTESIVNELDKKKDDLAVLNDKLGNLTYSKDQTEMRLEQTKSYKFRLIVNQNSKRLAVLNESIARIDQEIEYSMQKLCKAQENEKNESAFIASEKSKAMKAIEASQKELEYSKNKFMNAERKVEDIQYELEYLEGSIEKAQEEILQLNTDIINLKAAREEMVIMVDAAEEKKRLSETEYQEFMDLRVQNEADYESLKTRRKQKTKEKDDLNIRRRKSEILSNDLSCHFENSQIRLNEMVEKHEFIRHQYEQLGKAGTIFDFTGCNIEEMTQQLTHNEELVKEMGKNVNKAALQSLDSVEQQFNDLDTSRKELVEDKVAILEALDYFDQIKKDTLREAYERVNKDINNIFSTMLPGCNCYLTKSVNELSEITGIEFQIIIQGHVKTSLTELSGGQRSLIALSFILAMLKYRPAPIYILDEIDAALDLSHTHNIGKLIKDHFKESQFIIVSLKNDLFENANVLFKTALLNGHSTVTRYPTIGFL
uniref:Structural maintenance of chromosomes protein n=1 Tax=Rhabditophanes sp. KR3021 TaxID=114890 RepID=A0AC35UE82_9BILA